MDKRDFPRFQLADRLSRLLQVPGPIVMYGQSLLGHYAIKSDIWDDNSQSSILMSSVVGLIFIRFGSGSRNHFIWISVISCENCLLKWQQIIFFNPSLLPTGFGEIRGGITHFFINLSIILLVSCNCAQTYHQIDFELGWQIWYGTTLVRLTSYWYPIVYALCPESM